MTDSKDNKNDKNNKNDKKNTSVVGAKKNLTAKKTYKPRVPNNPKSPKPPKPQKPQKKYYAQIEYEDTTRTITKAIVEIDDYDYDICYRANLERCIEGMADVGGFWVNKETIIPFAKVYSVNAYEKKEEPTPPKPHQTHQTQTQTQGRGQKRRGVSEVSKLTESGAVNLTKKDGDNATS